MEHQNFNKTKENSKSSKEKKKFDVKVEETKKKFISSFKGLDFTGYEGRLILDPLPVGIIKDLEKILSVEETE